MAEIEQNNNKRKRKAPWKLINRCLVSLISLFFTQFAIFLVPHFFPSSSILTLLSLSVGVVMVAAGLGRLCKKLLGLRASAPAFVVFNILFIWCVYVLVIRPAISSLLDIVFNAEIAILLIGLCSILSSDPGYVAYGSSYPGKLVASPFPDVQADLQDLEFSSFDEHEGFPAEEESIRVRRVRYCKVCKVYVKGFDHHCPAFGNCIGEKNHVLFIIVLVGFIISEGSHIACSSQFATKSHILDKRGRKISLSSNLVDSTMLFSLLQVFWQVVFLAWHIYCVCVNITTDEWINWKRYPELQLDVQSQPGQPRTGTKFINPYDKGVLQNLKDFLKAKG